jgi:hypothetical protein
MQLASVGHPGLDAGAVRAMPVTIPTATAPPISAQNHHFDVKGPPPTHHHVSATVQLVSHGEVEYFDYATTWQLRPNDDISQRYDASLHF